MSLVEYNTGIIFYKVTNGYFFSNRRKFFMNLTLLAATPGVYYAFQNSDSVGKLIVVLLILCSVAAWSLMIDKFYHLRQAKRLSKRFLDVFNAKKKTLMSHALLRESADNPGPLAEIYASGLAQLQEFYQNGSGNAYDDGERLKPCKLSDAQLNAIEAVLERKISEQINELESNVGIVATLVSLSPFCGLFGTVWGVMMAFSGIAIAGKPDFTALAPGVAGALLTTVAGLVVAIPSLVGYNFMNSAIRGLTVTMDNFAEEFMVRVKLEQAALDGGAGR